MSGLGQAPPEAGVADDEGFKALMMSHARSLHRLAYRMTRNEQDAEDVVQEALLKVPVTFGTLLHLGSVHFIPFMRTSRVTGV